VLALAAANMLLYVGVYLCQAVVPLLAHAMGAGAAVIGWVGTAYFLGTVVARIPAGVVTDRRGRAWPLAVGAALCAVSAALLATARTPLQAAAFRALQGIGLATFTTAMAPAVAALAGAGRLTHTLSFFGISTNVAAAVGPALGIALLGRMGPGPGFALAALTCVAAGVLALRAAAGSPPGPGPVATPTRAGGDAGGGRAAASLWPPVVAAATFGMTYAVHVNFVPVVAAERAIPAFGLYYTVYAAAIIAVRTWGGRIGDRFGHAWMVLPGAVFGLAAWTLLGRAGTLPGLLTVAVLYAVAGGTIHPACLAALIARAPGSRRGTASAAFYLAYDAGDALGGPAVGALMQAASVPTAFDAAALVGLAGAAAMAVVRPAPGRAAPAASAGG
jgi:MFS family permease